ncbi:hypothetical protein JCM10207_003238 [Rhodosporidiobolus poonsookiae]
MQTAAEITLTPVSIPTSHPAPAFPSLRFSYSPSRDGTSSNLLILLHGLGDTLHPFANLAHSLNLPQTATLSLQAPERVPLLEDEAYQWWESFDALGELIPNPNPSSTLALLIRFLEHLTAPVSPPSSSSSPAPPAPANPGCGWHPSQLHLFGYAQGGSCASELALLWARTHPASLHLGSVVSLSAPLLSHPTTAADKRAATRVCVVFRKAEERMVGLASYRKGFAEVREVRLESGRGREGMPRGMDEWREIMRFWSETLVRRSAIETQGEVYEIAGGVAAAQAAGAKPPPSKGQ